MLCNSSNTSPPPAIPHSRLPWQPSIFRCCNVYHHIPRCYILSSLDVTDVYIQLYKTVLYNITNRFVQKEPYPPDWTKDRVGCGRCVQCANLDEFLLSPTDQIKDFYALAGVRAHLVKRLRTRNMGWTFRQGRIGNSYYLRVTKLISPAYKKQHDAWAERFAAFSKGFETLQPREELRNLLGEDYESLKGLQTVTLRRNAGQLVGRDVFDKMPQAFAVSNLAVSEMPQTLATSAPAASGAGASAGSQGTSISLKRKSPDGQENQLPSKKSVVQVIDLTEED